MPQPDSWTVEVALHDDRWQGRIAELELEFRGRSIEGLLTRAHEAVSKLLHRPLSSVRIQALYTQPEIKQLAEEAALLRHEAQLAVARERRGLARLARAVDSKYELSKRDIGALFGVHHRTVGVLMNQT